MSGSQRLVPALLLLVAGCMAPAADRPSATPTVLPSVPAPVAPLESPPTSEIRLLYQRLTGAGGGIFLLRADGTERALAPEVAGVQKHPDWAPDGDSVVFVVDDTSAIWVKAVDGSASARQVIACCDYPAWSPDGTRIAYSVYENGKLRGPAASRIEVLDLASGSVTVVLRLERPLLADVPRWSPDGTHLIVGVDQMDDAAFETGASIAIVPVSGGAPVYLQEFATFAYVPDWSTLDRIVFSDEIRAARELPELRWTLTTIAADGSDLRRIPAVANLRNVVWTPDGAGLVGVREETAEIVLIDPVSGRLQLVGGTQAAHPHIRPNA